MGVLLPNGINACSIMKPNPHGMNALGTYASNGPSVLQNELDAKPRLDAGRDSLAEVVPIDVEREHASSFGLDLAERFERVGEECRLSALEVIVEVDEHGVFRRLHRHGRIVNGLCFVHGPGVGVDSEVVARDHPRVEDVLRGAHARPFLPGRFDVQARERARDAVVRHRGEIWPQELAVGEGRARELPVALGSRTRAPPFDEGEQRVDLGVGECTVDREDLERHVGKARAEHRKRNRIRGRAPRGDEQRRPGRVYVHRRLGRVGRTREIPLEAPHDGLLQVARREGEAERKSHRDDAQALAHLRPRQLRRPRVPRPGPSLRASRGPVADDRGADRRAEDRRDLVRDRTVRRGLRGARARPGVLSVRTQG
ncbi:hypothetical protein CEUSTIGMA_g11959.t1 [Chlamydomonas eustigma]|uniref:Uncharacterized protein n=1 Tax=Chlamydomonas eustigma TaxID=1157962 RepID=A0A250XN96_9CHLO|nr:hypothetical protein CEUSTIGMA_g11959.t1 [Chlamydomonas eustigma]|eukprot:GAX84538.1 hypothetical protein CEUSTIGMA_g11959.t1 [Chlamydomonas eustigma]